jgi:hypothetical protein
LSFVLATAPDFFFKLAEEFVFDLVYFVNDTVSLSLVDGVISYDPAGDGSRDIFP